MKWAGSPANRARIVAVAAIDGLNVVAAGPRAIANDGLDVPLLEMPRSGRTR